MRPLSRNSNDVSEKVSHFVTYEDATFDGWLRYMRRLLDHAMARQEF